jgi:4-hydroxybenzoate polyprenyltransferase/phosphoserine phosphatase
MLFESILDVAKHKPWLLLALPIWLLRGKARLKAWLAGHMHFAPEALPYRESIVHWAREESRSRPVVLATASHMKLAAPIAHHLGFFNAVVATEDINLIGSKKAEALTQRYGQKGFDYVGDSSQDLLVWQEARQAILVSVRASTAMKARAYGNVTREFDMPALAWLGIARAWLNGLRVYQWVKNLLIFLAPAAAHKLNGASLTQCLIAFLAFGLAASGIYVLNDLLDLESDRAHARKKRRPFASGVLPLSAGLVVAPLLVASALGLSATLNFKFMAVLAAYLVATTAYSFWLKRKVFIDVAMLASLYTVRVVAGAMAIEIGLSFWLLAMCGYGFLTLALVKRYAEITLMVAEGKKRMAGRAYVQGDGPVIMALGTASGIAATLVLALYIDSQTAAAMYHHPTYLWSLCGLMTLAVGRLWIVAGRGEMHDDPILYVAKDRICLSIMAVGAVAFTLAV